MSASLKSQDSECYPIASARKVSLSGHGITLLVPDTNTEEYKETAGPAASSSLPNSLPVRLRSVSRVSRLRSTC